MNKADLGLFASNIRFWRIPEPYKGKREYFIKEKLLGVKQENLVRNKIF